MNKQSRIKSKICWESETRRKNGAHSVFVLQCRHNDWQIQPNMVNELHEFCLPD